MYRGFIYCFISPSNKKYYGQTINIKKRLKEHKYNSINGKNKFYNAIKKYGFEKFIFRIVESHDNISKLELKKILNEREIYWIDKDNTINDNFGYNLTKGGDGGDTLSKHPNIIEIKKKISKSIKGKILSNETKEKISESLKGRNFSNETKQKMSISANGKKLTEETKKKMSEGRKGVNNNFYGKHHSDTTKEKISESLSGEKHPQYGKKQSISTINKKIQSLIGKKHKKIICEYCNKEIDDRNYHRWHGDKCKNKKDHH